jgi:hypothetical protein
MKPMKIIISVASVLVTLALITLPAKAQTTYLGPGVSQGGSAADGAAISSVVVQNDANNISFTVNSTVAQASWIKYYIDIQVNGQAGSGWAISGDNNSWGNPIGISSGENFFIGTWGTGASLVAEYSGGGSAWILDAPSWVMNNPSSATMTFALSSLGLSVGSSFNFDVLSAYAGGSGAYSALDLGTGVYTAGTPWTPDPYDSATAAGSTFSTTSYTVVAVPEPTTLALLGGGVIFLLAQRRRVSGNRAA